MAKERGSNTLDFWKNVSIIFAGFFVGYQVGKFNLSFIKYFLALTGSFIFGTFLVYAYHNRKVEEPKIENSYKEML